MCSIDTLPCPTYAMPSFALRPCQSYTGTGKKATRSLLNGSLIRLASTTELMHVNLGTTDAKGHRVLLPQVGCACLCVAVQYACTFVGMNLDMYTADTSSILSRGLTTAGCESGAHCILSGHSLPLQHRIQSRDKSALWVVSNPNA